MQCNNLSPVIKKLLRITLLKSDSASAAALPSGGGTGSVVEGESESGILGGSGSTTCIIGGDTGETWHLREDKGVMRQMVNHVLYEKKKME